MKARLDRETVEKITVTILVVDVNAQFPPQQKQVGVAIVSLETL